MPQFTKKAIINSFYKLLEKKSFEKISVKDIVEDCGVNRKTFYYYFSDIYDLVEQVFRLELKKYVESLNSETTPEEAVIGIFSLLEKNKRAIYHIYNSPEKVELQKYIHNSLKELIAKINKDRAEKFGISQSDTELLCGIFVMTFSGMINGWISDGMDSSYYEKVKRVCVMLRGSVELMINNLRKEDKKNIGEKSDKI